MEAKLKALKEVEQIYRLSKKWRRNLPDEKRPDFERMADRVFRQAMEAPARSNHQRVNVRAGKHMHEHDRRSARLIERTLKSGDRPGRAALVPGGGRAEGAPKGPLPTAEAAAPGLHGAARRAAQ